MPRQPRLAARDAALLRLMQAHRAEYDALYDEERAKRGLNPLTPRRNARIAALRASLARLEGTPEGEQ